jgi:hypothetical protein
MQNATRQNIRAMHRALSSVSAAIGVGLEANISKPLTLPIRQIGKGNRRWFRQQEFNDLD